jgi:hypothetical protein
MKLDPVAKRPELRMNEPHSRGRSEAILTIHPHRRRDLHVIEVVSR